MSDWWWVLAMTLGTVVGVAANLMTRSRPPESQDAEHVHIPTPAIAPWLGRCAICGRLIS